VTIRETHTLADMEIGKGFLFDAVVKPPLKYHKVMPAATGRRESIVDCKPQVQPDVIGHMLIHTTAARGSVITLALF
jgi:hypothetical protein